MNGHDSPANRGWAARPVDIAPGLRGPDLATADFAAAAARWLRAANGVEFSMPAPGRSFWIDVDQRVPDVVDVAGRISQILPSVRVGRAGVVVMIVLITGLAACERTDAATCGNDASAVAGGFDQAIDPAFKSETIDDDQSGFGEGLGVGRCRLIDVCIRIPANEGMHLDPLATDALGDVTKNTEAGDDIDGGKGLAGERERRDHQTTGDEKLES